MAKRPARHTPGAEPRADKAYNLVLSLDLPDVPEEWLAAFEESDEALELQARLDGDLELFNRLALDDFQGPAWDAFADAVVRYGYSVLSGWTRSGEVFAKLKAKGLGGLSRPPQGVRWQADAPSIAGDAVTDALLTFRDKVLRVGRWHYTGGATLKTFFIGMCLSCYRNAWRRWYKGEFGQEYLMVDRTQRPEDHRGTPELSDPAYLVEARDELRRAFDHAVTPKQRDVIALTALNYRQTEIAEILGTTPKAVETTLRRVRLAARAAS